jgi:hypothetical protein
MPLIETGVAGTMPRGRTRSGDRQVVQPTAGGVLALVLVLVARHEGSGP